jgi:hypothetical protein
LPEALDSQLTAANLGKQKVCLPGGRQIRDTVTSIEHHWTIGKSGIGFDLKRLVMAMLA